jgi:hypothetical protein
LSLKNRGTQGTTLITTPFPGSPCSWVFLKQFLPPSPYGGHEAHQVKIGMDEQSNNVFVLLRELCGPEGASDEKGFV